MRLSLLALPLITAHLLLPGPALGLAPEQASQAAGLRAVLATAACEPGVVSYTPDTPPALTTLNSELAWRTATGRGVTVAVVDSGVEVTNAHLAGAVVAGPSFVSVPEADNASTSDAMAHGTAVAGQIAARPVDGSGVVGLAPESTILAVRVYFSQEQPVVDSGNGPRADRIAEGIRAAADAGAQIINVSMSTVTDTPELRDAVAHATATGSLVVASAGNRNTTEDTSDSPRYPAAYPEVLSVTSVDAAGLPTQDAIHGPHIDVAAPGTDVLTTFLGAGDCVLGDGVPSTSYATAYVSGAAALLAQAHPDETPQQWAFRLEVTAARDTASQRDDLVGWGAIRPTQALTFVDDGSAPGPQSPVHERPEQPAQAPQVVDLAAIEDPREATEEAAVWWTLGGVGAVLATVLLGGLAQRRRPTSRAR